jgi:hypothetical protein
MPMRVFSVLILSEKEISEVTFAISPLASSTELVADVGQHGSGGESTAFWISSGSLFSISVSGNDPEQQGLLPDREVSMSLVLIS